MILAVKDIRGWEDEEKKRKLKGFSVVELALIVVAIGPIGGVGYWAYQHNRSKVGDAVTSLS